MVADHDSKIMELVRRELDTLYHLIKIIDTLPKLPANEDLEEEIDDYIYSLPHSATGGGGNFDDPRVKEARDNGWKHAWPYENVVIIARHFAQWQKEQMMKDAIEAKVLLWEGLKSFALAIHDMDKALSLFNDGDKVKLLIIKED